VTSDDEITTALNAVSETCRHWDEEKWDRCGAPATIIVWGKLSAPEEFGPKCDDHWPENIEPYRYQLDQVAVFDLRAARRAVEDLIFARNADG